MSALVLLAQVFGWVAFFTWSISFYPQVLLMWRTKSSAGLSIDFMYYNLTGFLFYSIYCIVKYSYQHKHGLTQSVDSSDIAFAVHALILVIIQCMQCLIYKAEAFSFTLAHAYICQLIWVLALYNCILALAGLMPWYTGSYNVVEFLGYCKSFISFIKYVPQAWLNYQRQSTDGWAIENVMLDLTGAVFTFAQQVLDGYNSDDWSVFTSNVPKLILSMESLFFDLLFLFQHFVLYREKDNDKQPPADDEYTRLRVQQT